MADGQELKALAADKWNPYALAYSIDTDCTDPECALKRDGGGDRFITWNSQRWAETRKRLGLASDAPVATLVTDHLDTLAARLGGKLNLRLMCGPQGFEPAKAA